MRLTIRRLETLIECKGKDKDNGEDKGSSDFQDRLLEVQKKFHIDLTSLLPTLWKGIYVLVCIWSFVLYDIVSTEVSFGQSLVLVSVMLAVPYGLYALWACRHREVWNVKAAGTEAVTNPLMDNAHISEQHQHQHQQGGEDRSSMKSTHWVSSSRFTMSIE